MINEDEFIAQMTALVQAQNRLLLKLGNFIRGVGIWFYLLVIVGTLIGSRDWNSLIITVLTSPAKLAADSTGDLSSAGVVVDSVLSVFIISRGYSGWLFALHLLICSAGFYVSRPSLIVWLLIVAPGVLFIERLIKSRISVMEAGLARLSQVENCKEDYLLISFFRGSNTTSRSYI
jgi:hypothetical protein